MRELAQPQEYEVAAKNLGVLKPNLGVHDTISIVGVVATREGHTPALQGRIENSGGICTLFLSSSFLQTTAGTTDETHADYDDAPQGDDEWMMGS